MKNILVVCIIILVVSLLGNFYFYSRQVRGGNTHSSFNDLQKNFPLLSQRALSEDYTNDILLKFSLLRSKLRSMTAPYGRNFGFFFEYLPSGVSIGVNEKEDFSAASLLKVPVVMAYYLQQEEEGKNRDNDTVTLTKEMIHSDYGSLYKRGVGGKVTLKEAVQLALRESDNTAVEAITSVTDYKYFQEVYDGLDIDSKEIKNIPVITLKNYSSILKALFFASVVSREDSSFILGEMTQSIYKDKLPAGVSSDIKVAHKIGVADNQLYTDCGIVYIPNRPYILCMLSVSNEKTAQDVMRNVSKMVYSYVSSVKK